MNNLTVFDFEQSAVRVSVVENMPWWIAIDVCRVLGLANVSKALDRLDEDEKRDDITISDATNRRQSVLGINESGLFSLVLTSRKPEAKRFKKWITSEVIPAILKAIDEAAAAFGKRFGSGYEQRFFTQNVAKFHPHLALPAIAPEELASLATAKALLTPTEIAEQLGFVCKSNAKSFDGRRVNKLLEELGYQTKIDGTWSATDKAIDLNLCDRKPIDTGSRTQKDQLFWSVDIIAILQENKAQPLVPTPS
jgi:BRO family, N-terminal domain